jgi:hypothetical protein
MTRLELIHAYVQQATGRLLESFSPAPFSGWQVVEALWPLNERFRPILAQIRTITYDRRFEAEADLAVEALVLRGDDWTAVSPGAWRILLERQQQLLQVALMLESSDQPMTRVPAEMDAVDQSIVAIADVLHSMKLPMPPVERSAFALPVGSLAESSLRKH